MSDSLLSIANSALMASQYAISVASNNVANADTEGYVRRTVQFAELSSQYSGAALSGWGVDVAAVTRNFDAFLEKTYLSKNSTASAWESAEGYLDSLDNLFDQSEETGLSAILADYFAAWEDLSADPDSVSARSALLGYAEELASAMNELDQNLADLTGSLNSEISSQVDEVNSILGRLAELNGGVTAHPDDLELLDQRDQLLRDLSGYMDISVSYGTNGTVTVLSASGQALVSGQEAYTLAYEGPQSTASLTHASTFSGQACFEGSSSSEIVLQVVSAGTVDGSATAAQFKVSLDGGQTWLTDGDGDFALYAADGADGAISVDGVSIWLGSSTGASLDASGSLAVGDSFTVMAKSGLYWYENTSGKVNVTPLADAESGLVDDRVSGGSLAGLFTVRDEDLAAYQESLDALASTLVYQTNYAYSQGANTSGFTALTGTYSADDATLPLGSGSGLPYASMLAAGSLSLAVYDSDTGEVVNLAALDFDTTTAGIQAFDPAVHSLEDVAAAINSTFAGQVSATVANGTLSLSAADGMSFSFAGDSTGLLAALGLNTFFTGSDAASLGLNGVLTADPTLVNAGAVDASGVVEDSENSVALAVSGLTSKDLAIARRDGVSETCTLQEYFASLVSQVGADASTASTLADHYRTLADDVATAQEENTGVNLDEELVLLEKYQRAYSAASQIITTSNEMFETLMGML